MDAPDPRIAALRSELNQLKQRNDDAVAALEHRLAALDKALNSPPEQPRIPKPEKETPDTPVTAIPATPHIAPPIPAESQSAPTPAPTTPRTPPHIWLVRVGIALLVTGLVLLGNFAYQNWIRDLSAAIRLAAIFAASGALSACGLSLFRRKNFERQGEILLAGGLGLAYWATYAASHIERLRVIDSPIIGAILLALAALAIVITATRLDRQPIAVMGILLAAYATTLQPLGWLSALSNTLLALAGVALLQRKGWQISAITAAFGIYLSFTVWQLLGATGHDLSPISPWFLVPTWTLFTLPQCRFTEKSGISSPRVRAWFTAGNNAVFFALFAAAWGLQHGWSDFWQVTAAFGVVLTALAVLTKRDQITAGVQLGQGLGLITAAIILKFGGFHLPLALSAEALALTAAAVRLRGKIEAIFACLAGLASALLLVAIEMPAWAGGMMTAALVGCALIFHRSPVRAFPRRRWLSDGFIAAACFTLCVGTLLSTSQTTAVPLGLAIACAVAATRFFPVTRRYSTRVAPLALVSAITSTLVAVPVYDDARFTASYQTVCCALAICAIWLVEYRSGRKRLIRTAIHSMCQLALIAVGAKILREVYQHVEWPLVSFMLGLVGLAALGRYLLHIRGLFLPASVLALSAFVGAILDVLFGDDRFSLLFICAAALALTAIIRSGRQLKIYDIVSSFITRLAAIGSWGLFLLDQSEPWATAFYAITSLAILGYAFWRKTSLPFESPVFAVMSAFAYFGYLDTIEENHFAGVFLIITLLAYTAMHSNLVYRKPCKFSRGAQLTAIYATLWATAAFGLPFAAVTWAVMGFIICSLGLALRVLPLLAIGSVVFSLAAIRLFVVDIWDFTAFIRVSAFIALGISLTTLGIFYQKLVDFAQSRAPKATPPSESDPSPATNTSSKAS